MPFKLLCIIALLKLSNSFTYLAVGRTSKSNTILKVSEVHIPGYRESKLPFILTQEDINEANNVNKYSYGNTAVITETTLQEQTYTSADYTSLIPHETGHLLHKTTNQIFSTPECQSIIDEAERIADEMGWTTNRHGNYPTTDIPIVELPNTMKFLRKA